MLYTDGGGHLAGVQAKFPITCRTPSAQKARVVVEFLVVRFALASCVVRSYWWRSKRIYVFQSKITRRYIFYCIL